MNIQTPHLDMHVNDPESVLGIEDHERKLQLVIAAMEIVAEFRSYGIPQTKILEILTKSWRTEIPPDVIEQIVSMVFLAYEEGEEHESDRS